MAVKILELKGPDWLKGVSIYPSVALGGLFQVFGGCNPFEQGGLALPSYLPQIIGSSEPAKSLLSYNSGGNVYLAKHGDADLYQFLATSPYTLTAFSTQINQFPPGGVSLNGLLGAIIWQGMYIYNTFWGTNQMNIAANTLPAVAANDVLLQHITTSGSNVGEYTPMCVGPDGNLYIGNNNVIYEMTSVAGTAGNSNSWQIDVGFVIRDIVTDGRYLIIIADNNSLKNSARVQGAYQVQVYFWDMVQTQNSGTFITPTVKHVFQDSYAIAGKFMDNAVYLITYNGISICSSGSAPKLLRPFPATESANFGRPVNPAQVFAVNGTIFWTDGKNSFTGNIFAYGNPVTGQPKILYQPYGNGVASQTSAALTVIGNEFCMSAGNALYLFNVSTATTRGGLSITTLNTTLEAPYNYGFTKVSCGGPLTAGQSITISAYSRGGTQLISQETKSYNAANPKQNFLFKRVPTGSNQPERMEDLTLVITTAGGVALQRVAAYATPLNDTNEDI